MAQILVLTKNILANETFQNKLQNFDHEVFVSKKVSEELLVKPESQKGFLRNFDAVVFSETISNEEMLLTLPNLEQSPLRIYRVGSLNKKMQDDYAVQAIPLDASVEKIRETFNFNKLKIRQLETDIELLLEVFINRLASYELDLWQCLNNSHGTVSREDIIKKVWGEKPSQSRLSQLSATIKKMNEKFNKIHPLLKFKIIQTNWGKGYVISKELTKKTERV